ncbi:MAG: hypothetical protein EPN91_07170 [Salinibacterium sp.]|nr:MAG: hypothetical protein EPN91_07170 [Salinibacterium sp.]
MLRKETAERRAKAADRFDRKKPPQVGPLLADYQIEEYGMANDNDDDGHSVEGRRYHYLGRDADGSGVMQECRPPGDDDQLSVVRVQPVESGKPLKLGNKLARVWSDDGEHFQLSPVASGPLVEESHSGPPMVASNAYRSGWDRIFGDDSDGDTGPTGEFN